MIFLVFLNVLFLIGIVFCAYSATTTKDRTMVRDWRVAAGILVALIAVIDVIAA